MTAAAFVLVALRLTGLVGIAAVAIAVRRRAAAAEHHFIWMTAIGGALLLPFATRVLPEWRIGPAIARLQVSPAVASTPSTDHAADAQRVADEATSTSSSPAAAVAPAVALDRIRQPARFPNAIAVAIAIWVLGTLLCLVRLARAHMSARRIVRRAHAVGNTGGLPVLASDATTGPFTYGLFRPSIVMPADAATWTAKHRDAVLAHEAAHARRHDGLALFVAEIACAVYWWHPAVLFAARQAAIDCERACDDAVIRRGLRASEYGTQLLAQAQSGCAWGIRPLAATLFGPSHGIAARIAALLDPRVDRRALTRRRVAALVAVSLGAIALVAAAAPRASQRESAQPLPIASTSPRPTSPATSTAPEPTSTVTPIAQPAIATRPSVPKVSPSRAHAFAPACSQADARFAKTLNIDSALSFRGAGSTWYADGSRLLVWTGVDCAAWLRVRGPVVVDATWSAVSVGPGAEFVAHDEGPAGRREYVIGPTSASLSVNGSAVPIGAEHRDWIGMMILEYVRRTGLDATGRSRAIVASGGVSAILDEARKISGKDVRVKYLEAAFPSVAADRRPAFVRDAASLLDSASARAEFLFAIPREWLADEGVLAAVYTEAGVIEPDAYIERLLRIAPPPRPLPATFKPLVERVIASLQSIDRRTALGAYYLDVRP